MKKFALLMFALLPAFSWASGSFLPGGGKSPDEAYNRGKAVVFGRDSRVEGCRSCHKKFSRSKLSKLESSVAAHASNCEAHTPCYSDKLNDAQMKAINTYFIRRYNLR